MTRIDSAAAAENTGFEREIAYPGLQSDFGGGDFFPHDRASEFDHRLPHLCGLRLQTHHTVLHCRDCPCALRLCHVYQLPSETGLDLRREPSGWRIHRLSIRWLHVLVASGTAGEM